MRTLSLYTYDLLPLLIYLAVFPATAKTSVPFTPKTKQKFSYFFFFELCWLTLVKVKALWIIYYWIVPLRLWRNPRSYSRKVQLVPVFTIIMSVKGRQKKTPKSYAPVRKRGVNPPIRNQNGFFREEKKMANVLKRKNMQKYFVAFLDLDLDLDIS